MATVSGGVMAVFIGMGADPVAISATSVMAAPCGLYLSKLLIPETMDPVTRGEIKIADERTHTNVVGIQLGGIGAMAPSRRSDLASLGMRALLGGFLATLINAAIAGILMD